MAIKKKSVAKKTTKKKSSSKKSGGMNDFVNVSKLLGMAGGAFGNVQLEKINGFNTLDPKMKAGIKIIGGQYLPNMGVSKNAIKDDSLRNGIGDALIYEGVKELMSSFGISGINGGGRMPKGNEFLAVSIEGLEDAGAVSEDILAADEYDIGNDDDISAVNEDILGDDDMGDDDLSAVNEDILGDDDM